MESNRCAPPLSCRRPFSKATIVAWMALAFAAVCPNGAGAGDVFIDAGRGPIRIYVPSSYDPETPVPLVLLLHGYGASGIVQENYMRFAPLAEEYGFLYAHPDGTLDNSGARFWNATDACCNFFGSNVDDSGYLSDLIDAVKVQFTVDDRRVHLIGHSNGGFMSYRMACDHSETIASIASLAGAAWDDPADCSPAEPVHVLQIHGTNDTVIRYNGGNLGAPYPGAIESVEQWASFGSCSLVPETGLPQLDLDASIPGAESTVRRYATDCSMNGSGELWTIVGGAHTPNLSVSFSRLVVEYLLSHPKFAPVSAPESESNAQMAVRSWPSPFTDRCWIEMATPIGATSSTGIDDNIGRVVISDAGGRRIADLAAEIGPGASSLVVQWDGYFEHGGRAPAGVYFVTAIVGDAIGATRLIRVR